MYVHSFQTKIDYVQGANFEDLEAKVQQHIGSSDAESGEGFDHHDDEKKEKDTNLNNSRFSISDAANSRCVLISFRSKLRTLYSNLFLKFQ